MRNPPREIIPRRYNCHHYDVCLWEAARADTLIECRGCQRYVRHSIPLEDIDLAGCLVLLRVLFDPEYKKATEMHT